MIPVLTARAYSRPTTSSFERDAEAAALPEHIGRAEVTIQTIEAFLVFRPEAGQGWLLLGAMIGALRLGEAKEQKGISSAQIPNTTPVIGRGRGITVNPTCGKVHYDKRRQEGFKSLSVVEKDSADQPAPGVQVR